MHASAKGMISRAEGGVKLNNLCGLGVVIIPCLRHEHNARNVRDIIGLGMGVTLICSQWVAMGA